MKSLEEKLADNRNSGKSQEEKQRGLRKILREHFKDKIPSNK